MLFAKIPLTILAGLALVNGHQIAKRQDTGTDTGVDPATDVVTTDSGIAASATSVLGSLSDGAGVDVSSLVSVATGTGLSGVTSAAASYLSQATGIVGSNTGSLLSQATSLLNGVTGTSSAKKSGSSATGSSSASSASKSSNAAIGGKAMGAMSSALLAGLTTVSAGLLAGAWFVL